MSNPERQLNTVERVFASGWFWLGAVALVFGFNIIRSVMAEVPQPPKVLLSLPQFTLTNQAGEPFGSADLEGKIWIANFVFTSCATTCPRLTEQMQKVKHRVQGMGDAIHLVSFSVDPERDTPDVLAKYSAKYGATPSKWAFLTGSIADIEAAVVKGFKMPIEQEPATERTAFDITHGTRFVLVDPQNNIRGFYETGEDDIDRLVKDVGLVFVQEQQKAIEQLRDMNAKRR